MFKVGDLVMTDTGWLAQIIAKSDNDISLVKLHGSFEELSQVCREISFYDNALEPWKPEVGEWIISLRLGLCKVLEYVDEKTILAKPSCLAIWNNQKLSLNSNVEPFIGQLPSFLKDKYES